ncbi:MAG TPA: isoprenylcysteine carboxylmethyltransferase family protein [Steroidobacteraceae bacterium]|jgi:protein-S-isoprenylcysteine O-methyltransferase Ste14|nr:isoprenylcysteine carboxylmethyltransferase family protein [Steroidobacteraceae bacterium]
MAAPDKVYPGAIGLLWLAWLVYWRISAANTKATQQEESGLSRASHIIPVLIGGLLIGIRDIPPAWLHARLVPDPSPLYLIGIVLVVAGLGFAVWARVHLGGNWSAVVTLKEGHSLVRTGPYGLVRHPIYTGLLIALLGTALSRNDWCALLGFAIITAALIRKLSIEERWMMNAFKDEYAEYKSRVAALIPFVF